MKDGERLAWLCTRCGMPNQVFYRLVVRDVKENTE
jgi:hypothetical protein